MKFGAHMSISGGLHKAFALGEQAGCDTIQIFSKNQQQWKAKPLQEAEILQFKAEQVRTGYAPLIVHDSYLINLASPTDELWEKSIAAFAEELERCAALGIPYRRSTACSLPVSVVRRWCCSRRRPGRAVRSARASNIWPA
jgi:deoxyribonuclease IV